MHQHQREKDSEGRILATEDDFKEALELVSESLRRAWQTLTPAEETVLEVIEKLPEQLRKQGFRRRDFKTPGVSDRRIKEVLKSLTDTGYLDCDGRQGPQGYSYTVARDAEEVSLGISLRPVAKKNLQTARILPGERPSPDTARRPMVRGMGAQAGYRAMAGEMGVAR